MKPERSAPPPKKAPTLIGRVLSGFIAFLFWLLMSLLFSILIEWGGLATVWQKEGHNHAAATLAKDIQYLDQRVEQSAKGIASRINKWVQNANAWIKRHASKLNITHTMNDYLSVNPHNRNSPNNKKNNQYQEYILVVPYVVQTFFVRLALVVLSMPIFALCAMVGMVDGLVERDLRRWGGGRESSLTYNLARKSVFPSFISACVIYISLPISIHPLWIIGPFALVFGVFSRVTFERLKKYF